MTVSSEELAGPTELLAAVKATGQRGGLRFGLLLAGEDETLFQGLSSEGERVQLRQSGRNYGVGRALWEGGGAASHALGWMSTVARRPDGEAIVHAVDGHALTASGRWEVDGEVITSSVPGAEDGYGGVLDIKFAPARGLTHTLAMDHYDGNLDIDDLGYLRRNDLSPLSISSTPLPFGSRLGERIPYQCRLESGIQRCRRARARPARGCRRTFVWQTFPACGCMPCGSRRDSRIATALATAATASRKPGACGCATNLTGRGPSGYSLETQRGPRGSGWRSPHLRWRDNVAAGGPDGHAVRRRLRRA